MKKGCANLDALVYYLNYRRVQKSTEDLVLSANNILFRVVFFFSSKFSLAKLVPTQSGNNSEKREGKLEDKISSIIAYINKFWFVIALRNS